MTDLPLHYLGLADAARLVRERSLSPMALTAHMLDRIGTIDPILHSYARVTADEAMRQAELAEVALAKNIKLGPLHGVPVGVKDLFWTKGVATAAGMPIHSGFIPKADATAVRRLRDAGAIILGKLQMTEGAFAVHHPAVDPPVNPWDGAYWPGASSSGSGVATAAGLCFASLGSDTGGSIRFPCAANGLTGIKPTWGRVSRYGTFELAATLDHVGPIARDAIDAALMLSAIAGYDPLDPSSLTGPAPFFAELRAHVGGLRIGVDRSWNNNGSDAETLAMIEATCASFAALGATICEVRLPDAQPTYSQWEVAAGAECAIAHSATYPLHAQEYGPALARLIDIGRRVSSEQLQKMQLERMTLRNGLDAAFSDIDLILLPVQPYAAPSLDQLGALAHDAEANSRLIQYTSPFNFTGHPAISLPGGFTEAGLPLGFQLVAAHCREDLLCSAGIAFQRNNSWHEPHPVL